MFRCIVYIKIEQQPTREWPNRKTVLNLDFLTEFECMDSWKGLTNKGRLVIPKNLYFKDEYGKMRPLKGTNVNVGGFSSNAPLFLRGDKVSIVAGYKYKNKAKREIEDTAEYFSGYISKVGSKIPIELELEDNMWKLKQVAVPTHTFSKRDTLEDIMAFILQGTSFTFYAITSTTFGSFTIGNETACEVLQRLNKSYGFEFYFRGNELRGGALIYIESEAANEIFDFAENIIENDLEYNRKDDIVLSAIAHNTIVQENGKCKDGSIKTKKVRLEVLVTLKNNPAVTEPEYTYKQIKRGDVVPENTEGERRTFFFPGETTVAGLAKAAFEQLKKYYYNGFKGGFTTFGIPFLQQGDNAILVNKKLPELDGIYKIKSVERYGAYDSGLKQKVTLDYKVLQS